MGKGNVEGSPSAK
jgi:hypothetical protein